MKLPKYKFDKIKPFLRDILPTGLYVLVRDQYNNSKPMELKEYLILFRQYCTDEQIKKIEDTFKNIINMDINIEGSRLPFIKDKKDIKLKDDDNNYIKSIKFTHKIVTNLSSSNIKDEEKINIKNFDNRKIENIIKKSIKPSENIDLDNNDI